MAIVDEKLLNDLEDAQNWAINAQEITELLVKLVDDEESCYLTNIAAAFSWLADDYDSLYVALEEYQNFEKKGGRSNAN